MTVAGRHAEESFGRIAVVVLLHGIKPRLSVFSVIWLNRAKIAAALEAGEGSQRPDINPVTLSIEAKLRPSRMVPRPKSWNRTSVMEGA
jgi:hypothetical protein